MNCVTPKNLTIMAIKGNVNSGYDEELNRMIDNYADTTASSTCECDNDYVCDKCDECGEFACECDCHQSSRSNL